MIVTAAPEARPVAEDVRKEFEKTWSEPSGFPGRLATVDNVRIGVQFVVTALTFFLVSGAFALLMRIQLAVPDNTFLGPDVYNRMFTMHGTTMMYLFAVPVMEGLAALFLPMMLGGRDLAYPRLTALSYWVYLSSGLIFFSGFLFDQVADVGWFAYTPLSAPAFSQTKAIDFWLVGLGAAELAGIAAGAELTISILKLRAPGMTLSRLPLYAWAWLATAIMIVFAFTTLFMATVLLESDHALGTQFFNDARGGNHLLWQHLFWFFGHPEVYIIFLPATGIVSMIVTTFARRILGYTLIAVAVLLTGFISFGLWVHHMYTTGLPELAMYFFAGASLMIAIASGTQIFAWIASLWGQRPRLQTPLLFVLGFVFIFVLGGLTGVMVAIVPFDWQVHDTYFLVAHFHYVLIGGAVFPLLGGLYYWVPKLSGRMPHEFFGKCSFWLTFIGFNFTFFPMHIMGLLGMPRRVYTYADELGIDSYNMVATVSAFVLALGFLLFFANILWSLRYGVQAGRNPWGADSLEWSFETAPQILFPRLPVVIGRHPLWDEYPELPNLEASTTFLPGGMRGRPGPNLPSGRGDPSAERISDLLDHQPTDWRATLMVDAITGRPQAIARLASPSYMPLVVATGIMIITVAMIARYYWFIPVGAVTSILGLIRWLWPDHAEMERIRLSPLAAETGLPTLTTGSKSLGWLGLLFLMAVVGWCFGTLLYAYFYLRLYSSQWPQDELPLPEWSWPSLSFICLLAAAGGLAWGWRAFGRGSKLSPQIGLGASSALATFFLGLHWYELSRLDFNPQTNAYGSAFFVMSWALDLAVLTGLGMTATALTRSILVREHWEQHLALHVQIATHYWYFTAIISLVVFATLYVSPYLI